MATDYRDYFNTRLTQELEKNALIGIDPKYDALQEASRQKQALFEQMHRDSLKQRQLKQATLGGRLGLEEDGITRAIVDLGDAFWQGTKNTARAIGATQDVLTGDLANLELTAEEAKAVAEAGPVEKQQLMAEIARRKAADADPNLLSATQNVAGAMANNPAGTAQFLAEQAPNSIVALGAGWAGAKAGAAGGAAVGSVVPGVGTAVGGAVGGTLGFLTGMFLGNAVLETGNKAIEKAGTGGMTQDKANEALKEGAIKGGVITAVDAATLGVGGRVAKSLNQAAIQAGARAEARVLANAGVDITDMAAVQAALSDPLLRGAARAAGRAAAKETSSIGSKAATAATGLTMETVGEGVGEHLGELAATGKADIYDSVMEAAAGFTQSVPEAAYNLKKASGNDLNAKEMTKADLSIPDPVKVEPKANPKAMEVVQEAAKTGDVSALLDEKQPTYAPDKAIAALAQHAMQPDTTEETKQANFEQAGEILADLTAQRDDAQRAYDAATPVGIADLKQKLADAKANGDTVKAELLELMVKDAEDNPTAVDRLRNQLAVLDSHIEGARTSLAAFADEMAPKNVDVAAEIRKLDGAKPEESQATADVIINLSMTSPDRVDADTAASLANDTNNGLSDSQRNYFRAFSQARLAENQSKDLDLVNQDVFYGGNNFVGLSQYRARTTAALAAGNRKEAEAQVAQLGLFVEDHKAKAAQVDAAYQAFLKDGKERQVRSDGQRGWFTEVGITLSNKQREEEGAVLITARSKKLVSAINTEARVLQAGQVELQAALELKPAENKQQTQEQSNGNQAAETQQTEAQGQEASEPAAADSGTESTEAQTGSAAEQTTVEEQQQSNEQATTEQTQAVSETEVQTTQEQSPEETKAPQNQQGLSVLNAKSSEQELPAGTKLGQVYQTINKVVAFLTQRKTPAEQNTDIAKDRPLVSIQNFMSQWSSGTAMPSEMFGSELLDTELGALANFKQVYERWAPLVRANMKKGALPNLKGVATRDDFLFEDPIQDFFNKDGSVDENVVTAIVYGAYSWLVESSMGPALKDNESILKMHGVLGTDVEVTAEGRAALANLAVFKDAAITSMGRFTVDALGLQANEKADASYMAKLTAAFGLHSLVLLAQDEVNLIDTVQIDGKELMDYLSGLNIDPVGQTKKGEPVYPKLTYLRIRRDSNFVLPDVSRSMRDAAVQSFGVIQRLFSTEHASQYATWAPVRFRQQRAKKTDQKISNKQRKILEAAQQTPHRIIPAMWDALTVLGDEVILTAAGWTQYEPDRIQKANRETVLAKNQGLEDQLAGMKALVQNAIDNSPQGIAQPFYAAYEVWRNFRVGVATRDMNLQSSKIHRFMFTRPEWESTIAFDDAAAVEQFMVSVAQAFGVKVDQQPNAQSIEKLMAMVNENNGRINTMALDLAKALAMPDQQVLSEGQKQDIGAFAAANEGMQSLQALVAYGQYLAAAQSGADSVTVNMLVGVDGKTNGPILTHLALGAASSADDLFKQLNRGGMYRDSDQVKNYNHWYTRLTSQDLYEDLAEKILSGIQATDRLAAISVFTNNLIGTDGKATKYGRNLAKTPLTSFVFGSSITKSIENMQDTFRQSIYDRIEAVANGSDKTTKTVDIVRALNTLLGSKISEKVTIEWLMEQEFSKAEQTKLNDVFNSTIGNRVRSTMETYFSTYLERRNEVNGMIQSAFNIYNVVYQDLRVREINRLMDEGEIAFSQTKNGRVPLHDMTASQEKALRDKVAEVMPLANTAYTVGTDELDAGLYMAKTRKAVSSSAFNRVKVQLGKLIHSGENWRVPYITGFASETVESSPGVAGLPYFMHSLDSYIMHTSIDGTQTLNVHDEAGNGVNNVVRTAQAINKATFEGMLKFSPATEAYEMLGRSVVAMAKMIENGVVSSQGLGVLKEALVKQLPKEMRAGTPDRLVAREVVNMAFMAQYEANRLRLETLSQMTAIDQYTWEGGEYAVTDEDRAAAKTQLDILTQMNTAAVEFLEAADKLGQAFEGVKPTKDVLPEVEADPVETVFGKLGQARRASDPDLVAFFENNPNPNAGDVVAFLAQAGRLNKANRKILQLVSRTISPNLTFKYVTSKTTRNDVIGMGGPRSVGWYSLNAGKEEIYIKSPEYVLSRITPEVLLHEMVHAAIAYTIDRPTAEAKELIAELEQLRQLALANATEDQKKYFAAALNDIQEFVAYGLTSEAFQKEILEPLTMESKTRGSKLINGMQKFISTLTELLLGRPNAEIDNGLAVLVSNVSGLFAEAAKSRDEAKTTLNYGMEDFEAVDRYTTMDIFNALDTGAVQPAFGDHLRGLLNGIVDKLHGPFGAFKEAMRKDEAATPLGAWLKAMATGQAPLASAIVASNFAGSSQEGFVMQQVEATVKAALQGNESTTKALYKELYKLYTEAYQTLKPSDFDSQADYDFLFDLKSDNGDRSDYLARFAAIGLANERVAKLLQFDTAVSQPKTNPSLFDRMVELYTKVLEFFAENFTHVHGGMRADVKLEALVDQLVDIEARKRATLMAPKTWFDGVLEQVDTRTRDVSDTLREKISDALSSDFVKNNTLSVVRAAGTVGRVAALGQADALMANLRKLRDVQFKERDGLGAGILNELKGPLAQFNALLRATKHNETQRKTLITQHAALALKMFKNSGKDLTTEAKKGISNLLMRSGAHNLLQFFTMAEIEQLLSNKTALMQAIDDFQNRLSSPLKHEHILQANGLGMYKALGRTKIPFLMLNAHAISRMAGTKYANSITEQEAAREEPLIAALATLYAIKYARTEDRLAASEVIRTENARTDGNGVEFVLNLHQQLEQDSLKLLFGGNKMLMEHGYTPDIVNPHTTVTFATAEEGKDLVAQNYARGSRLPLDPTEPDSEPRDLYVLKDGGLMPWLSGIISLTSMKAKGTAAHSGYLNVNTDLGLENAIKQATMTTEKHKLMPAYTDPGVDLGTVKQTFMAPIYNDKGEMVNYRYLMQSDTKDAILERDNRFDQLLGTLAGSIFDKVESQTQNEKAIEALRQQYMEDGMINAEAYVEVGAKSNDPEMRELWDMLPKGTQDAVKAIWGYKGMRVRKDSLDLFFGYRKLSVATFLQKERAALDGVQKIAREVFHLYAKTRGMDDHDADNFAKRMGNHLVKGERAWQEIVREVKDIVVVKNIVTLLGNIYSNDTLLYSKGVTNRWHHQLVAIKGALAYQSDSRRLQEIQTMLQIGQTQGKDAELRREEVRLKDLIDRNPVKPLIDAGLMPTIVEDVAAEEDIYSYKSWLVRKTEKVTGRIPEPLRNAGRVVYMAHDTKAYQFLSKTTQLSDFVARYALYQHLVSRSENPLSHADAVQEASDSFVNYDIPMHRKLQYMDDMGFTPFMKYFFRIQRVLLKTFRENPARVLSLLALNQFWNLGPIVLESSMVTHLGNNPFRSGALQIFGVLDELPAVAGAMKLIK